MTFSTLILILLVAALAGYAGYMMGRAAVAKENRYAKPSPLPAPFDPQASDPEPQRGSRGIPPAASAGGGSAARQPPASAGGTAPAGTHATAAPKRGIPPPAAAGIADLSGGKSKRD